MADSIFKKSLVYAGLPLTNKLMPDVGAMITANMDSTAEIKREAKTIADTLDQTFFGSRFNQASNIFKSFKRKNDSNPSSNESANDLSDDFMESSLLGAAETNKTTRRGFSTVAAINTKVGSKQIQTMNLLRTDINKIVQFNSTHTVKMYDNMNKFFTQTNKFYSAYFDQLEKAQVREDKLRKMDQKIMLDNTFKVKEYLDTVSNNLTKQLSSNNKDLIKELKPSMGRDIANNALGNLISKATSQAFKEVGKTISNIPNMLIMEMNHWAENAKNPFIRQLGKILGVDFSKKGLNFKKSNREKAIFDGATKKAIVNVIPSLLSKILNAIQSQSTFDMNVFKNNKRNELVHDSDKGVFTTRGAVQKANQKKYVETIDYYLGDMMKTIHTTLQKTVTDPKMLKSMYGQVQDMIDQMILDPKNMKSLVKGKLTGDMIKNVDENTLSFMNSFMQSQNKAGQGNIYGDFGKALKSVNNLLRSIERSYDGSINAYDETSNIKKALQKPHKGVRGVSQSVPIEAIETLNEFEKQNAVNKLNLTDARNKRNTKANGGFTDKLIMYIGNFLNRPLNTLAKGLDNITGKIVGFILDDKNLTDKGFTGWFKEILDEKIFDPITKKVIDPVKNWFIDRKDGFKELFIDKVSIPFKNIIDNWKKEKISPKLDLFKNIKDDIKTYLFGTKNEETNKNNKDGWFSKQFSKFTSTLQSAKTAIFGNKDNVKEEDFIDSKDKSLLKKIGFKFGKGAIFSLFAPGGPIIGGLMSLATETKAFKNTIGKAKEDFKDFLFGKFDDVKGKFTKNGILMDFAAQIQAYGSYAKERMNSFIFGDENDTNEFIKNGGITGYLRKTFENLKNGNISNGFKGKTTSILDRFESWATERIVKPFTDRLDQAKDILFEHIAKPIKHIAENVFLLAKTFASKAARALWNAITGQSDSTGGKLIGRIFRPLLFAIDKFVGSINWATKKMLGLGRILADGILGSISKITDKLVSKFVDDSIIKKTNDAREKIKEKAEEWAKTKAEERAKARIDKAAKKLTPDGIVLDNKISKTNDILSEIRSLVNVIVGKNNNSENPIKKTKDLENPITIVDETKTAKGQERQRKKNILEKAKEKFQNKLISINETTAKATSGIYKAGGKLWKGLLMVLPAIAGFFKSAWTFFKGFKVVKFIGDFTKNIVTEFIKKYIPALMGKEIISGASNIGSQLLGNKIAGGKLPLIGTGKQPLLLGNSTATSAGGQIADVVYDATTGKVIKGGGFRGLVNNVGGKIANSGVGQGVKSVGSKIAGSTIGQGVKSVGSKIAGSALGAGAATVGGALAGFALMGDDYSKAKEEGKGSIATVGQTLFGSVGESIGDRLKNAGKQALKWGLLGATIGAPLFGVGALVGGGVGALVGGLAGMLGGDPEKTMKDVKSGFSSVGKFIKKAWDGIVGFVGDMVVGIKDMFGSIFKQVGVVFKALFNPIGTLINAFTKSDKDPEKTWVEKAVGGIGKAAFGLFNTITFGFGDMIVDFFTKNKIGKAILGVFITIGDTIGFVLDKIGSFFGGVWDFLTGDLWSILKPIGNVLGGIWDGVKSVFGAIGNGLSWLGEKLGGAIGVIGDVVSFFLKPIGNVLGGIFDAVSFICKPIKWIADGIGGIIDFFVGKTDEKLEKKEAYDNMPEPKKPTEKASDAFKPTEENSTSSAFNSKNVKATYDGKSGSSSSSDISISKSSTTFNNTASSDSSSDIDVSLEENDDKISKSANNMNNAFTSVVEKAKEDEEDSDDENDDITKEDENSFKYTFGEELFRILKMFFKPRFGGNFKSNKEKVDKSETSDRGISRLYAEMINSTDGVNIHKENNDIFSYLDNIISLLQNIAGTGSNNSINSIIATGRKVNSGVSNLGIGGAIVSSNRSYSGSSNANKIASGELKGGVLGKTSGNLLNTSVSLNSIYDSENESNVSKNITTSPINESDINSKSSDSFSESSAYKGDIPKSSTGTSNIDKFINETAKGAMESWTKYGILPSVVLGQGALESGWGSSNLAKPDSYNLFGIKNKGPAGSKDWETEEFINGAYQKVMAPFAKYHDWNESIEYHGKLLSGKTGMSNYLDAVGETDPLKALQAIHKGGYATAPDYPQKVMSVIKSADMIKFDKAALANSGKGGPNDNGIRHTINKIHRKSSNRFGIGGADEGKSYGSLEDFLFDKGLHNFTQITSEYGEHRTLPNGTTDTHYGIDVAGAPEGSPIRTPVPGELVLKEGVNRWGEGNWSIVRDNNDFYHIFMHQQKLIENLNVGDKVKAGDKIGYVGNTGNSFGAHLHYQIQDGTSQINQNHLNPHSYDYSKAGGLVLGSSVDDDGSSSNTAETKSKNSFDYKKYINLRSNSTNSNLESALSSIKRGLGGTIQDNLNKNYNKTPQGKKNLGIDFMPKYNKTKNKTRHYYKTGMILPGFPKFTDENDKIPGFKDVGKGGVSDASLSNQVIPAKIDNTIINTQNVGEISTTNKLLYAMLNILASINEDTSELVDKEFTMIMEESKNNDVNPHKSESKTKSQNNDDNSNNIFTPIINSVNGNDSNPKPYKVPTKIKLIAEGN